MCFQNFNIDRLCYQDLVIFIPASWVPRFPPSLMVGQEDSQNSICKPQLWFISKITQSKISKEKRHMGRSPQETRFKLPSPSRVTQDKLREGIQQVMNCHDVRNVYQGSSLESVPKVLVRGLVTYASSAQHIPKFQIPKRKAAVQHKPYCLHKQFRPSEALFSYNENFL